MTESKKQHLAGQILKVFYAPHKVFREIIQKPKYFGPILIMVLFTAVYALSGYVFLSRTYNEQVLPTLATGDEWTQNSTLWTSNATPLESADCIDGGYYGNNSIEFSIINSTDIWMQSIDLGPINCSGSEGYKNMSFRLKLIYPNTTELAGADIYLFSDQTDYFYYNFPESLLSIDNATWTNFTIPVESNSDWTANGANADWGNLSKVRFGFKLSENADVNVLLDGLLFRGVYKQGLENVSNYMLNLAFGAMMQFVIRWVVVSGLLFIMAKAFGSKTAWRPILILVGFILVTMFTQAVINTAAFSTLSRVNYPFELSGGTQGEAQIAYNKVLDETLFASQIISFAQIAIIIWTIALCALASHISAELSWPKASLVATVACFTSMFVESLLIG